MNLSEIEERAESLARDLADTESKNEALLLGIKLKGLKDLAQIKAVRYGRDAVGAAGMCHYRWTWPDEGQTHYEICTKPAGHRGPLHYNSVTGISIPINGERAPAPGFVQCPATKFEDGWAYRCRSVAGHVPAGAHEWAGAPVPDDDEAPTKPAVDRLHELVSAWTLASQEQSSKAAEMLDDSEPYGYHNGQSVAWDKAASMLNEILMEGEL